MFLGTDSARQFPKCTTLLQTLEVNVKRQPDVLKAFPQAAGRLSRNRGASSGAA